MNERFLHFVGLREDPFHVSPNPRFFFSTPAHETALAELMFGIETRRGILMLTGEAGTGKTSILNQILNWLRDCGRSTAFIFHTRVEPIGLLRLILMDFGVPCESKSKSDLVKTLHHWLLQRHAAGDLPVLILDEAQALPPQTLDEIRLILNVETPRGKLLQIILAGQPELEEKLRSPALRQLRQRIMFHSRLPLLTEQETAAYISWRLAVAGCSDTSVFPSEVLRSIHAISRGIPRVVNLLCAHALISAFAEQRRVISTEMIQSIAADFDLLGNPLAAAGDDSQPTYRYSATVFDEPEHVQMAESSPPAVGQPEALPVPATARAAAAAAGAAATCSVASAVASVPVVPTVSLPVAPASAPMVAPVPLDGDTPTTPAKPAKYWRKHRSKSPVAAFAQDLLSRVQHAWEAFQAISFHSFRRFRHPISAPKTSPPVSVAPERVTKQCWTQIEFDIMDKRDPRAFRKQIHNAVQEQTATVKPSAMRTALARSWRRCRSTSSAATARARNSLSSLECLCSTATRPIVDYVRSVVDSFVRDCHMFFRVSAMPNPATGVSDSVGGNNRKLRSLTQGNAAAVARWLRQPINPPRVSSRASTVRSSPPR